jgi:Leucine-rich repeat (LRR) protein
LESLYLRSDELKTIQSNWLKCLENLKELNLQFIEKTSIDDDAFDKLIKLETLNLSSNKLKTLK